MDKKVLETTFVDVYFDDENKQMSNRWKASTSDMDDEGFKEVVLQMTEVVIQHKPKFMLADTLVYDFTVTPDLQEWSGEYYFAPAIKNGLEKLAFLMPEDFFTEVSIQQMMEEDDALGISTRYFDSEDKAKDWLHQ